MLKGRELLVGVTYAVVFSIVGQGLTIGPLVRWLAVGQQAAAQPKPIPRQ